jgi:hypothetical protein
MSIDRKKVKSVIFMWCTRHTAPRLWLSEGCDYWDLLLSFTGEMHEDELDKITRASNPSYNHPPNNNVGKRRWRWEWAQGEAFTLLLSYSTHLLSQNPTCFNLCLWNQVTVDWTIFQACSVSVTLSQFHLTPTHTKQCCKTLYVHTFITCIHHHCTNQSKCAHKSATNKTSQSYLIFITVQNKFY